MDVHNFDNDDHFIISQELIQLMQHILENHEIDLKKLLTKAIKTLHPKPGDVEAQEAQLAILDFLGLMEVLVYELKNEQLVNNQVQKQLIPSIDHIDRSTCDGELVESSIENTTTQMEDDPQANPQELFLREILKKWRPTKDTFKH